MNKFDELVMPHIDIEESIAAGIGWDKCKAEIVRRLKLRLELDGNLTIDFIRKIEEEL